jgi:hypothetical protein
MRVRNRTTKFYHRVARHLQKCTAKYLERDMPEFITIRTTAILVPGHAQALPKNCPNR